MPLHHQILDGLVAWLLRYVLKYRLKVIRANLEGAFDYVDKKNLDRDIKSYYFHLAKILRQTLVSPSRRLLERRMRITGNQELDQWLKEGKSVIVTLGHVGNWEWAGHFLSIKYPEQVGGLYKKIKSTLINNLMYKRRLKHTKYIIEIKKVGELIKLIQSQPLLIYMIADQNPGSSRGITWTKFLRKETAFVTGPENIAKRYGLPVVYFYSSPRPDGGYDMSFVNLYDGEENIETGEIMKRYANILEKNIHDYRINWLWSHKRWKRVKPVDAYE